MEKENFIEDIQKDLTGEIKRMKQPKKRIMFIVIAVLVILAGIGTGFFLSKGSVITSGPVQREVASEDVKPGVTVGIADEKSFKDSTEGQLEKGGLEGEGSHKLVRPGGDDQTVYLTSSIVDLDKFVGRKVKVWGETFSSQKAGWLMDVGKLKVLE